MRSTQTCVSNFPKVILQSHQKVHRYTQISNIKSLVLHFREVFQLKIINTGFLTIKSLRRYIFGNQKAIHMQVEEASTKYLLLSRMNLFQNNNISLLK